MKQRQYTLRSGRTNSKNFMSEFSHSDGTEEESVASSDDDFKAGSACSSSESECDDESDEFEQFTNNKEITEKNRKRKLKDRKAYSDKKAASQFQQAIIKKIEVKAEITNQKTNDFSDILESNKKAPEYSIERLGLKNLVKVQPIGSAATDIAESEKSASHITVKMSHNSNGERIWDKHNFCMFCQAEGRDKTSFKKLGRQLEDCHSSEREVLELSAWALKKTDNKDQKRLLINIELILLLILLEN